MPRSTGESGADVDLSKIRELEERLDNFRIQVADDMTIRGSAWQGFAHNAYTCDELGQGGTPTPPSPGACCLPDGTCEEVIPSQCGLDGGTFFGGSCTPNPCPQPTGACCVGSDCSIETESDCTDMGGTYQGDDTTCDPNPCTPPCCENAFLNPSDGMYYHGKHICFTYSDSNNNPPDTNCTTTTNICSTYTIDPDTCVATLSCSGSYTITDDVFGDSQSWVIGPDPSHCAWSAALNSQLPAPFTCATCFPLPPGCPGVGFLEDKIVDCDSSCSDGPPNGSQSNSVRIAYFDPCTHL